MKTVSSRQRSVRLAKQNRAARQNYRGNGHPGEQAAAPAISANLKTWLGKPKSNLIDGKWVSAASGKKFDVFNPADASVIAHVPDSHQEDINRAVAAARRAFETG